MQHQAIRDANAEDLPGVLALWRAAAAAPSATDTPGALLLLLGSDPHALMVAEDGGALIGSLIAAWDGWRANFYRLAVHPAHRRAGVGMRLVREGERRLLERGALRMSAIVASDEAHAPAFWRAAGYALQQDRRRFVRDFAADGPARGDMAT